jgi:vacuolar-type H+-ATPase subunit E/Vma4
MISQYDDEKYTELMAGLLAAAMLEQVAAEASCADFSSDEEISLPDRYEVLMNKRDRARVEKTLLPLVCKKLKGRVAPEKTAALVIAPQTVAIDGGLILRCGDIEINCSLSLIFAQLRDELEGEVSQALFHPPKRA